MIEVEFRRFEQATGRERLDAYLLVNRTLMPASTLEFVGKKLAEFETHLMIDEGGLIAAAGLSLQTKRNAFLNTFVVDEERRKQGHGTRLLGHIEQVLLDNSDREDVLLALKPHDEKSKEFFGNRGFFFDPNAEKSYMYKRLLADLSGND